MIYIIATACIILGTLQANLEVTKVVGDSVTFNCFYEIRYKSHGKYWCFGNSRSSCETLVHSHNFWKDGYQHRAVLTEEKMKGIFFLTIKNVQLYDAGFYYCKLSKPVMELVLETVQLRVLEVLRLRKTSVAMSISSADGKPLSVNREMMKPNSFKASESLDVKRLALMN
ncbi:CMRF35-like molecule 2 [Protopterus annectens]|uniref:CMRF35-like molecule 2 n=1 Tax=Protopterus annectens TaxID=7888 RepID=UPI001CFA3404|nr:CMRF35-like molecule 2 [Protopterus annectens]